MKKLIDMTSLLKNDWENLKNLPDLDKIPDGATRRLTTSAELAKLANVPDDTEAKIAEKIDKTEIGSPNGLATLDNGGKIPSGQLPSFVDDVLAYNNKAGFPANGESGKIYIDESTQDSYRWTGASYIKIGGADLEKHSGDYNNPHKVSKIQVGLANVDNTSDVNKPVSTQQQTALDQKIDTTLIGAPNGLATLDAGGKLDAASIPAGAQTTVSNSVTDNSTTSALSAAKGKQINDNANLHYTNYNNPHQVTKAKIGLSNVDNTSDANKPISTLQQTALDKKINTSLIGVANGVAKLNAAGEIDSSNIPSSTQTTVVDDINSTSTTDALSAARGKAMNDAANAHYTDFNNPHQVNKTDVGLSNVDNTSDVNKPISTSQQLELDKKINITMLGAANGVPRLDASGKIDISNLPAAATGASTPVSNNLTTNATDTALSAAQGKWLNENKEDKLPNPSANGKVLSSTTAGVRSWIDLPSGGAPTADILADIKTMDGAGSGLDADLLDGKQGTDYVTKVGATVNKRIDVVDGGNTTSFISDNGPVKYWEIKSNLDLPNIIGTDGKQLFITANKAQINGSNIWTDAYHPITDLSLPLTVDDADGDFVRLSKSASPDKNINIEARSKSKASVIYYAPDADSWNIWSPAGNQNGRILTDQHPNTSHIFQGQSNFFSMASGQTVDVGIFKNIPDPGMANGAFTLVGNNVKINMTGIYELFYNAMFTDYGTTKGIQYWLRLDGFNIEPNVTGIKGVNVNIEVPFTFSTIFKATAGQTLSMTVKALGSSVRCDGIQRTCNLKKIG